MLKILPFTALRTMESVVRLKGFGRAAEELNVTQSAVSQHIRSLEEWSGHKLLVRGARTTTPTEAGLRLADAVAEGFGLIEAACEELRDRSPKANQGIVIAAPPGFAFVWLLPRLLGFDEANQNIPISISTDSFARDLSNTETDVIIHYGTGRIPGMHTELLLRETMAPVCTPEIAARIQDINDLAKCTILIDAPSDSSFEPTWKFWAREVNVSLPKFDRKRSFVHANMVVQAAIEGMGVAMGRSSLVNDALAKGALVHPFDKHAVSQLSYWFVCRSEALKSKSVQAFRRWLTEEAAKGPSITE